MYKIAVLGLGYVGLPLAHAFSHKYKVVGFDINQTRTNELTDGVDRTKELDHNQVTKAISNGIVFTYELEKIKDCSIYIITVPTPINKNKKPDLTPLISASEMVGKVLSKNDVVIYESTVYPGATEEVCVPVLEEVSGLVYNKDFYCGYSPERINPGDKEHTVTKIKKITSGSNESTARKVDELYRSVITAGTHLASSIKVAEAAKVIENSQRDINIAFVNELAMIFNKMNINTSEVLEAAGTKWNFLPFKPGLVGGHCIGVDPYYLTYKAEEIGYHPQIILSGRRVNDNMGAYVANQVIKLMIKKDHKIKGSKVLVLGVTFKENCPDIRNTKVIDVIDELSDFGCNVEIFDPWADGQELYSAYGYGLIEEADIVYDNYDAIVLAVAHSHFSNISFRNDSSQVIYDIKSMLNFSDGCL